MPPAKQDRAAHRKETFRRRADSLACVKKIVAAHEEIAWHGANKAYHLNVSAINLVGGVFYPAVNDFRAELNDLFIEVNDIFMVAARFSTVGKAPVPGIVETGGVVSRLTAVPADIQL